MTYNDRRKMLMFYYRQWSVREKILSDNRWEYVPKQDSYWHKGCNKSYCKLDILLLTDNEFERFLRSSCIYDMSHVFGDSISDEDYDSIPRYIPEEGND